MRSGCPASLAMAHSSRYAPSPDGGRERDGGGLAAVTKGREARPPDLQRRGRGLRGLHRQRPRLQQSPRILQAAARGWRP